jgi:hypothetical protein
MARNVPMDDFEGQVTRRDAGDWGADVERSSISAGSDWATNHARLRTDTVYVPSAQEVRESKKAKRGYGANIGVEMAYPCSYPPPGKFVERPVSVPNQVRGFMGKQKYRTAQKPPEER